MTVNFKFFEQEQGGMVSALSPDRLGQPVCPLWYLSSAIVCRLVNVANLTEKCFIACSDEMEVIA